MLTITQANAGDSRTVLGVNGRAKPLSLDHKPKEESTDITSRGTQILLLIAHPQARRLG
jgi:serine/threonine protein phosphatase PrpC